jgi:hypothetical protein
MVRKLGAILSLMVCCAIVSVVAQKKPDFTGTWVVVSGGPMRSVPGVQIQNEVHQSALMITSTIHQVSTATGAEIGKPLGPTRIYLDGHERSQKTFDTITRTRTVWEGETLVITTETSKAGSVSDRQSRRWSLDKDGRWIIDVSIEHTNGTRPTKSQMVMKRK